MFNISFVVLHFNGKIKLQIGVNESANECILIYELVCKICCVYFIQKTAVLLNGAGARSPTSTTCVYPRAHVTFVYVGRECSRRESLSFLPNISAVTPCPE